jgi:prepilin-type N-terminal cleavage/methylation domain-containing protein
MNSKGMTLIETIVVIVLLGVIGLFTFQFVSSGVETYITASNQSGLLAEAKLAMERMAREIRDAENILAPASGSSSNSINFIKSHSTAIDSDTNITFQKSGTTLERKRGANPAESLAENVSNFNVTNNLSEIKLELTLSLGSGENVTLHTKVYPKNLPFDLKDFGGADFDGNWQEVVQ